MDVSERISDVLEELPRRRGVRAERAPFGRAALVYIHGRSQAGRIPENLRRQWTAGLNRGLTLAGHAAIDPAHAWFPFYGDHLSQLLSDTEIMVAPLEAAFDDPEELVAPAPRSTRELYDELLLEAASRVGLPDELRNREALAELPGWLSGPLGWIADRTGLDGFVIATVFSDVAAYLDRAEVRSSVLDTVLDVMPTQGPVVLVAHSLGSVVAMDLLMRLPAEVDVVKLVTCGSPLGLDTVHRRLLSGRPVLPPHVQSWTNAWCPADAVAVGCPLRPTWEGNLDELITDNPKERAHSIDEYLGDPRVAESVRAALR